MWDLKASVILPCYNRNHLLPLTLEAFRNQSLGAENFEVIVVDDGSTEDTAAVVAEYLWEGVRYYWKPNGGISSARNYGARFAANPIIIFSDPDVVPSTDYVQNHISRHSACSNAVVIGGKRELLTHLPTWMPTWPAVPFLKKTAAKPELFRTLVSKLFNFRLKPLVTTQSLRSGEDVFKLSVPYALPEPPGNVNSLVIPWIFTIGCNVSVPYDFFQQSGGFDENFSGWGLEDIEFGYRLYKAGGRFIYAPDALGYHQTHKVAIKQNQESTQTNLRYFIRKHATFEVKLHADYINGQLTVQQYDALVRAHYAESDFGQHQQDDCTT